ncbi:MAG TPA: pilus assembly protein [Anaerolineae bacterium]|nr:pilus assembly protein [Anaerolineae bacterium]
MKKGQVVHKSLKGQSIVEFALVLPFLLLLFVGMIEVGYAMYDYIVVSNANREGVRLAARGRFTDQNIIDRVIGGGGFRETAAGGYEPLLSPTDNFGMIITHIPFPNNTDAGWQGNITTQVCCQPDCPIPIPGKINVTICTNGGVIADGAGGVRTISASDSRIVDINEYQIDVDVTSLINEWRADEGYNPLGNEIVVVETFFAHPMLLKLPDFFPVSDPLSLYFSSSMRVTLNR